MKSQHSYMCRILWLQHWPLAVGPALSVQVHVLEANSNPMAKQTKLFKKGSHCSFVIFIRLTSNTTTVLNTLHDKT